MLHLETIDSKALELLRSLQSIQELSELRLVGGTALALQLGHRKSIDLDLFGIINSDYLSISKSLDEVGSVTVLQKSNNINVFLIDNVKVDIVNYHYSWLEKSIVKNRIIMADKKDIAAMKLAAITGRGTKKDFIDLYFLLQVFTLKQVLNFYTHKYHDGSVFLVLKSLSYFDDAEQDPEPTMLIPISWVVIKNFIKETVEEYLRG